MQILTAEQIRAWDQYTITQEPVASIDLMERAATACVDWLLDNDYKDHSFQVFCGKGNNGGDGLVIARLLAGTGHAVTVSILEFGHLGTPDFQANLARIHATPHVQVRFISSEETLTPIPDEAIVIDALLGSGLNRPLEGLTAAVVSHINQSGNTVIAIDMPTGLFADSSSKGNTVVIADHTLAFQCFKPAFLVAENSQWIGELSILDIGLLPDFLLTQPAGYQWIDQPLVQAILQPRNKFAHKGNFGHAALVAGSKGMMGAAVLAARSCLRSGTGKLTCHIPEAGYTILQLAAPEAMCKVEGGDHLETIGALEAYSAVGIGPGWGQQESHASLLSSILQKVKGPLVIDADGLNTLARNPDLLQQLPPQTILTPHVGELERLFGKCTNDFERIQRTLEQAAAHQVTIILKGAYSLVATPGGLAWFNSTGNPGMATGGTGDVLTGLLTGLLAQGYIPEQAAILAVYLHGLAGDLAAEDLSEQSLLAGDLIDYLPHAFLELAAGRP
ncbi:MAG: NAD(P)H-hydrate dehydratase [Candidatus Pseudobacter hemicellulosilyticus]|uniref:Bifunctional NAD(P)H-hydrate repair enzyme n=1 Tax=Candidatus Pseudobacter hemicellulosilyticus TaxID=3121375 RepID=A0AAJ6BEC3_9BACT|nr:MAG: NAD(P)H-hydrate dehydratase [Pseudobacter sp.]